MTSLYNESVQCNLDTVCYRIHKMTIKCMQIKYFEENSTENTFVQAIESPLHIKMSTEPDDLEYQ